MGGPARKQISCLYEFGYETNAKRRFSRRWVQIRGRQEGTSRAFFSRCDSVLVPHPGTSCWGVAWCVRARAPVSGRPVRDDDVCVAARWARRHAGLTRGRQTGRMRALHRKLGQGVGPPVEGRVPTCPGCGTGPRACDTAQWVVRPRLGHQPPCLLVGSMHSIVPAHRSNGRADRS